MLETGNYAGNALLAHFIVDFQANQLNLQQMCKLNATKIDTLHIYKSAPQVNYPVEILEEIC